MNHDDLQTPLQKISWPEQIALQALNIAVVDFDNRPLTRETKRIEEVMASLLSEGDDWAIVDINEISDYDAIVVWRPCGDAAVAAPIIKSGLPTFALSPALCFHPFHASFEREIEFGRGLLLAAHNRSEIEGSLRALRAKKLLQGARLLVIDDFQGHQRGEQIATFATGLNAKTGIEILHLGVPELLARAAEFTPEQVSKTWSRLQSEVFEGTEQITSDEWQQYALQATRLYLALRELLLETDACGVTTADIQSFLLGNKGQFPEGVMPNIAYGALVDEGFLVCEEADIEVLASELIMVAVTGLHPTMSNIYLSHRDQFDALDGEKGYTPEKESADFEQCRVDNIMVAAHFSTSGVLPPNMRLEARATVRETLPSWPGQYMVAATPQTGPIRLARLHRHGQAIHYLTAEVIGVNRDDSKGWYRGRWFLQVESVNNFIAKCQHQHYAIGPQGSESAQTTWNMLLRLCGLWPIV